MLEPHYLREFSIVVVSNMVKSSLLRTAALCAEFRIPLISIRSYGLIGSCEVQVENHEIIEGKKDWADSRNDLRLHAPFKELEVISLKIEFCYSS